MALFILTAAEVQEKGLTLVGSLALTCQPLSAKTLQRRFKAHYGCDALVAAVLWEELQTTNIVEAAIQNPTEKDFQHYMMTLFYLQTYPTEEIIASRFGVHEQTARKWVRHYIKKIASFKDSLIRWPTNEEWGDDTFIISVDCVNFGINEPRHPVMHKIKKYFDRKGGKAGMTYEIALHLWENRIVWVNGPFPPNDGGDRKIFIGECTRDGINTCLNDMIPDGKKAIADKIYKGLEKVALHNSLDSELVREFKRRARSRQETINARLKSFGILRQRFRHGMTNHQQVFDAIAVLCVFQLNWGSPLFDL